MPGLDEDSLASLIAAELAVAEKLEEAEKAAEHDAPQMQDVTEELSGQEVPREADVFGIPPVFGLGSGATAKPETQTVEPAPAPPDVKNTDTGPAPSFAAAPAAAKEEQAPDPLDEIERLIGPALRVQQVAPAASPALRSLATPTIPKQERAADAAASTKAVHAASIEEAILAAAATSGAKVEWVEPTIAARLPEDDEPELAHKESRRRVLGMTRSLAGPLVATLLLGVAAIGLYTVLGLGGGEATGPAPLLAADTTPTKEIPPPAPDAAEATQSVVFNEIAGVDTGAEEQIVSRDQADMADVTEVASADFSGEGLVNRKVRTVTVRPDGTIVSSSDSLAGSAMLPVDRPTVPEVPGADFSTPDLIASVDPSAAAAEVQTEEAAAAAAEANAAGVAEVTPVEPGSTVPAVDLAGNVLAGKLAPVPMIRPASFAPQAAASAPTTPAPATQVAIAAEPQATLPMASPQPAASQAPVAQPDAAVASTSGSAPAYVQLSSQRTEEAARQTAEEIAARFGPLFGGAHLEVQRVDLGERGIFYRVRMPADSLQSANAVCASVKANGGDCFTL